MAYFREFGAGVKGFYRKDIDGNEFLVRNNTDLQVLINRYDGKANCALSVYTFTKEIPNPRERHENIIFDVIAFDFDGELEEVKKDLHRLKKGFLDQLELEALFMFTGGRGFHVYIYFEAMNPKTNIKRFIKHVQKVISEECKLTTIDPQTFGDTARLFRVPGTRHLKSGLYCTPLTQEEALNMSMEHIKKLSTTSRAIPKPKSELKKSNKLFRDWLEYMDTKTFEADRMKKSSRHTTAYKLAQRLLAKSENGCVGIKNALDGAKKGERDNTLVGLVYYCKMKGLSEEDAVDYLLAWANKCEGIIDESDIKYKVNYHYRRNSTPCAFLGKCSYCDGCELSRNFHDTVNKDRSD